VRQASFLPSRLARDRYSRPAVVPHGEVVCSHRPGTRGWADGVGVPSEFLSAVVETVKRRALADGDVVTPYSARIS